MGLSAQRFDPYLPALRRALPEHGVDTPLRVAHFLAQVLHESGGFRRVRENMSYSAERLLEVFPSYIEPEEAADFARKPKKLANRVYADRLGNGDEASGDGYRYRGRGLIQITGKGHYEKLSRFLGVDVVAQPDLVASDYPVESAVYFWLRRNVNEWADRDDLKGVTRRVHGRLGGLARRNQWLDRAKAALCPRPQDVLGEPTHRVSATALNLRTRPVVRPTTRIAVLDQGAEVVKLGPARNRRWARVRALVDGRVVAGVVGAKFLEPLVAPEPAPELPEIAIPAVHLAEGRRSIRRARDGGRAFPLGEPRMPRRRTPSAQPLLDIAEYLDSEDPDHLRYRPKPASTFCNIYAYDYCYLAGVYLPRVYWNAQALRRIEHGQNPDVHYGRTVRELNANALFDWLRDHGRDYGWKRETDLTVLQDAANAGQVCLIVAQRTDLERSGHITAVVPEHGDVAARRKDNGNVTQPVESQAGRKNARFVTKSRPWWNHARYRAFAFWRAE